PCAATRVASARDLYSRVRARVLEVEQQGYKIRLALNERWPALRIRLVAHNERADTNEYLVGISASLPLPLWNTNTGKIETERARAAKVEAELMALIRDVERKVADAEFTYRSWREEGDDVEKSVLPQTREAAEKGAR